MRPCRSPLRRTPYARAGDGPVGLVVGIAFLWVMRCAAQPLR